MARVPAPLALVLGEVPESLGHALARAGLRVRNARGWADAGNPGGVVALVTASHIRVGAAELARLPELRVVGRAAAGLDNVDLEAAEKRGLVVVHAPEANAQSAAELTLALLFAAARRLTHHDGALHAGAWSRNQELGIELSGKRLGIVGLGRVGSRVARMALAIPMTVIAYDPYLAPDRFELLGCERAPTLEELASSSEVLTLHCPLTGETRGMIGRALLERLPKGAIVLNCARGEVLDEHALAELLASEALAAAGIDCWAEEPPPAGHPLLSLPPAKLVATPHVGARTPQARARVAAETAERILGALRQLELL